METQYCHVSKVQQKLFHFSSSSWRFLLKIQYFDYLWQANCFVYFWIKDRAFNWWGNCKKRLQPPPPFVAISSAEQAVIGCGYFWTTPLSSSEHDPTQLSLSKWCQDGWDPTDVTPCTIIRLNLGKRDRHKKEAISMKIKAYCVYSDLHSDVESGMIMHVLIFRNVEDFIRKWTSIQKCLLKAKPRSEWKN